MLRAAVRCALPLVLVLTAPAAAFPQSLTCHTIRGVESAAELSRRLTGDWNTYQPWFQIRDEASRIVPKSQYDRIRPGWRACIVKEAREEPAVARQPITFDVAARTSAAPSSGAPGPVQTDALGLGGGDLVFLWLANTRHLIADADLTRVWIGATIILALFGWRAVDGYVGRRKTVLFVMNHFAQRFVREFERPLIQRPAEPPLRSLVRVSRSRGRVEILLAPGPGRRYPNLSDHKKNVEYDVARILRSLADDSFVPYALYSQGGWVVLQFRFKDRKPTGVACRSFF